MKSAKVGYCGIALPRSTTPSPMTAPQLSFLWRENDNSFILGPSISDNALMWDLAGPGQGTSKCEAYLTTLLAVLRICRSISETARSVSRAIAAFMMALCSPALSRDCGRNIEDRLR